MLRLKKPSWLQPNKVRWPMADVVSPEKRKQMMAGIKAKNTRPEIIIRRALHKKGFRYRLHDKSLPANPDIVLPKYNAIILVNGCFWHGHDCHLFKWPKTRKDFWKDKVEGNKARDSRNHSLLMDGGWRILSIWECAIKGKYRISLEEIIEFSTSWLQSNTSCASVSGTDTGGIISGEGISRT